MHPFASYVLRSYYKATGWNEDNLYANITRSSNAVLDFTIPRGLHLHVSKSPNELFKTTYSMNAMPSLNGSVGYIFTSCPLDVKSSGNTRFKDLLERFKVYDQPRRPEGKEEEWLAGNRIDTRDYLLYGRYYLPTGRLDALYSTRLSATLQALVAAISDPPTSSPPPPPLEYTGRRAKVSNLMLSLQHDVGKWCTEYTWSAEDEMWGVRGLYNFGRVGKTYLGEDGTDGSTATKGRKGVDEEDPQGPGLRGRFSAGAELYFSAKERSAGVSTGIRFTTVPDATPPSFQVSPSSGTPTAPPTTASAAALSNTKTPPQTPTTITALFNPMLGHLSGAYTARVSPDLSLSSRFDFNVYSFESEWTMGAELWLRRARNRTVPTIASTEDFHLDASKQQHGQHQEVEVDHLPLPSQSERDPEIDGVVKVRASTNNDVSLMWESRFRNMLVGFGVMSDLSNRIQPIRAIGLELSYFSSE